VTSRWRRAGLHLLLYPPDGTDAAQVAAVVREAAAREVVLADLARYATADRSAALVIGYGNLADPVVDETVALLANAARAAMHA
jgi:GntR family transcriptional regulator/MocR family aminotransferase